MNCPKCSSLIIDDQQFCRSCGESLQVDVRRPIPPVFWGLLMAFGGILIAMSGKLSDLKWLLFAGVFLAIAGIFFIPAASILQQSGRRKRKATVPATRPSLSAVESTNKLPPIMANDHFSSVTEGTTDLLRIPAENSKPGKFTK